MAFVTNDWEATLDAHRSHQRDVIHRAAVALATEHGVAGVGMAEVARRAGISRATLYKYFDSVEDVLASYMITEVDQEHRRLLERLTGLDSPMARLRLVLGHLLAYFSTPEHLSASTVIAPGQFSPAVAARVGAAMGRLHDMVRDEVAAAARQGALRSDVDPDALAEVFQHLLTAGRSLVVSGRATADDAAELIWTQYVHGAGDPRA
jgi:AcrR family transcriptional regulator